MQISGADLAFQSEVLNLVFGQDAPQLNISHTQSLLPLTREGVLDLCLQLNDRWRSHTKPDFLKNTISKGN